MALADHLQFDMSDLLRAMFKTADTDDSGNLSRGELNNLLVRQGYKLSWQDFEDLFGKIDTDKDGAISFDEFKLAMTSVPSNKHKEAQFIRKFRQYDKDNDGFVTEQEFTEVFKQQDPSMDPEYIKTVFRKCDKDGSGMIEYEEFVSFFCE